jgi:hypothetical protein
LSAGIFFRKFFSAFFAAAGKNMLDFDKTQTGIVAEMLHNLLHKSPSPTASVGFFVWRKIGTTISCSLLGKACHSFQFLHCIGWPNLLVDVFLKAVVWIFLHQIALKSFCLLSRGLRCVLRMTF